MKEPFLVCFFFLPLFLHAQQIIVGPTGDYLTLNDAEPFILSGDSVMVQSGTYSNGTQFLEELHGEVDAPIVIYSEQEHSAIFDGGTEGIHLINCSHLVLDGFVFSSQTGNGVNIDDGGDYNTPTHHIEVRNCVFEDINPNGNHDFLKLSGLDSFTIRNNQFLNGGTGGSGVDMVGCHWGVIEDNEFRSPGSSGIQAKGGTQYILIQRNFIEGADQRGVNLGGSTGFQFFRPPLPDTIVDAFEAADLQVYSNIFVGSRAPIAYVGSVRVKVVNNTIYHPDNWVLRILQETVHPGFLECSDNEFRNNIVQLESDLTEVNIGPNTLPDSFIFTNNMWYNESSNNWAPMLPVEDSSQVIDDPMLSDPPNEEFDIMPSSPAVGNGKELSEPETDFVLNFFDESPSIGAYEGSEITDAPHVEVDTDLIEIFPNPSLGTFRVEGDFSDATIEILNVSGNVLDDYSNASSPLIVDLTDYPPGTIFVRIVQISDQSVCLKKIIRY